MGSSTIQSMVRKPQVWLSSTGGSLREQVLRGGTWVVMGDALAKGAGFIRTVVLGRILLPSDFGLLGIALLVQQWLECFTETGVSAALIQKRGDIAPYLDTAWTIQVMRGIVVGALVLLLAGPAGQLFNSPQAAAAIRCLAATTLLWGLVNPGVVYLRRELRFGADVRRRLCGVVTTLAAAEVFFRLPCALRPGSSNSSREADWRKLARTLPAVAGLRCQPRTPAWSTVARMVAGNYRQFLEITAA